MTEVYQVAGIISLVVCSCTLGIVMNAAFKLLEERTKTAENSVEKLIKAIDYRIHNNLKECVEINHKKLLSPKELKKLVKHYINKGYGVYVTSETIKITWL